MNWFVAEDRYYYNSDNLMRYLVLASAGGGGAGLNENKKILQLPTLSEIQNSISTNSDAIFIAPYYPPAELKTLFVTKILPNRHGVLTTQEKNAGISERIAMEERLGLSVVKSNYNLSNIGGADMLKDYTNNLKLAEKQGYKAKAILLAGIPGTGKTFFVKCFAGELGRLLIQLNLSLIMESTEPIAKLNSVFEFFDKRQKEAKAKGQPEKYVVLIDEIEKMIGNGSPIEKRILGRLLTVMNDANTNASEYQFDIIFCATANNLNTILKENPELLRRGRFDELFFLNLPRDEQAREMFAIYMCEYNLEILLEASGIILDEIMTLIEGRYRPDNSQTGVFPYSPAEISTFCKQLDFLRKAKIQKNLENKNNTEIKITEEDIDKTIKAIIPIVKSAREGTNIMVGQKELFVNV